MSRKPAIPEVSAERLERFGLTPEQWDPVYAILRRRPEESAQRVLTCGQILALLLLLAGIGLWLWRSPMFCLTILNGALICFYLILVAFKLYLIHVSLSEQQELSFGEEELAALKDDDLPVYTVLVPLYHEAESLPRLVRNLGRLDYPHDKLDVLLLMEEDDEVTQAAAQELRLPSFIRKVVVPDAPPKTKPKACNLGLSLARGQYLVVYDAEDRPDPDQLKKAVLAFRRVPENVVCIQAKLNFYNQRQNLLTRLFTAEYSMWFDLYLPGLSRIDAPIPLGGTSNHFRTSSLRELLGWDPYNVTEDCDLGTRLAAHEQSTRMLDSTTWEEACSDLGYWIRQRSRWTKGYIQTYLVHMRHPLRLLGHLGLGRSISFHLIVGGTPLCLLINPLYWCMTLGWFVFRWEKLAQFFPFPIILWGLVCLFAGNFVFVYSSLLAAYRRGYYDLVKYGLLVPFYWMLMTVGAWKGFLEIIYKPHFWQKTRHALDLEAQAAAAGAAEGNATSTG